MRVITEAMPAVRSVALGVWIGTGSRVESDAQAGLSHLIEHLLFRGSERYSSLEIDEAFDEMGAELNAGTGKETTSVYARVLDVHLERALELVSEMVWRPVMRDLDAEREIILEEIAMYEDDPQDKVFDLLGEATFGSDPLGRAVIGRAAVIRDTPREEIAAFHAARYRPSNVVVAAAGSVDHDSLAALVERFEGAARNGGARTQPTRPPARRAVRFETKETEQFHVCLGGPGLARDDERRFALRVLDNVLGASGSSRLFQEVREKRGLAYAIYSFLAHYEDAGQVGIYVGTRPENVEEALAVVGAELERLRRGARHRGRAAPRKGERQGPHAARAGVDLRTHEQARLFAARRAAAVLARRTGGPDRRGHARRPRRARGGAVGDHGAVGSGDRRRS